MSANTSTAPFNFERAWVDTDDRETLEMVLGAFRAWAADAVDDGAIEAAGALSERLVRDAAGVGIYGLSVPERYEGAGLSMSATARVVEEVATRDRSLATSVGLHNGLGVQPLIRYGAPALAASHLPRLAGGTLASFCATEANAGSHIAGLQTTARTAPDGGLLLNGEKIFVTNGAISGVFTVLARTPGLGGARQGTSLLLLDREMPGLWVGPEESKLGITASSTTTVRFDDVSVPLERVLGEAGRGLEQMHHALTWGRTLMAAGALGTARAALARTLDYVRERRQFGRRLGDFGQVRRHITAMDAYVWAAEAVIRHTTQSADSGEDIGWHSAVAKVFASEVAGRVVDQALQLHGGNGFIEDTGIARMYRDCRITRIYEGANDVLRMSIATGLFGANDHGRERAPLAQTLAPALAGAALAFEVQGERLAARVADLQERLGLRVYEHQMLLAGLADAAIARTALLAVIRRADRWMQLEPTSARAQQALRVAAYLAVELGRAADRGLARALDTDQEALAHQCSEYLYAG